MSDNIIKFVKYFLIVSASINLLFKGIWIITDNDLTISSKGFQLSFWLLATIIVTYLIYFFLKFFLKKGVNEKL